MTLKVIKLTSGDTLVGDIFPIDQFNWQLSNPVQFTMSYGASGGGSLVASRWLETNQTVFALREIHIVAQAEPTEMLIDYYNECLEEVQSTELEGSSHDDFLSVSDKDIMH